MPEVKMTEDEEAEEIVRRLKTPPAAHNADFGNGDFTVEMWFYKDKWEIKTKDTK